MTINANDFVEQSPFRWRLKKEKIKKKKADVEIFASERILAAAVADGAIQQVINVASLPGIVSSSIAMPDIHYGYGFCIGGVAAFPADSGIVLPGGVGYDINCGVRLLASRIKTEQIGEVAQTLGHAILRDIPTGLTTKSVLRLTKPEFTKVIRGGAGAIIGRFGGDRDGLAFVESGGNLPFESPDTVSERAYERGRTQLGSLGSGNHFIEIQAVEKIYDRRAADAFGLEEGSVSVMIHTGSRGFGHQIASDYIEIIRKKNLSRLRVDDPQLIYADIKSGEGRRYLQALNAAANFAWANRQLLMETVIAIFERIFHASRGSLGLRLVYDQAHNIAKFETHRLGGESRRVLIHRKGATRAFPAGHEDLPAAYKDVGQPVLIPGSMGTSSYVLKGTRGAMETTMGTSAHGAGRQMSRHKAVKLSSDWNVRDRLKTSGIYVFSHSNRGLREEIPEAYKAIDEVVEVTEGAGISQKVARLTPIAVIKG